MKKSLRSAISLLLAIFFTFSFAVNVGAKELVNTLNTFPDYPIVASKVQEMLPSIYSEPITKNDRVSIGNQIPTYYVDNNNVITVSEYASYPVFVNGILVSIADVTKNADGKISQVSLGTDYAVALQKFLSVNGNEPFAIFFAYDGVYLKFEESEYISCIKPYSDIPLNSATLSIFNNTNTTNVKYSALSSVGSIQIGANTQKISPASANTVLFDYLNVTNVKNASTSCCPGGICWAACIAMMANYYRGTSYSALQVHNICGCLTSNYHNEEKSYIRKMGMRAGGPYYSTGSLAFSFSTLYDCIEGNTLLLLDLQATGVAHNVVAYGYYANGNSLYFYIMDPNTGVKLLSFPSSSGSPVRISLSGHNYQVHCYITAY